MDLKNNIGQLEEIARLIRIDIVTMIHKAGDGHPGPALSATDLITALYFHIMNVKPKNPGWEDRDRFILSKGHGCPALYAALSPQGIFFAFRAGWPSLTGIFPPGTSRYD